MVFGLVMLVLGAALAVLPIPSAVVTIIPHPYSAGGEILRSKVIPPGIKLFQNETIGIQNLTTSNDLAGLFCSV